ncbi:MAG: PDZ domain-containing protein [Thermoanaerobaculia bacterium]|nr:PDZ domain-containing protein [Thermoanaerobaculia bacterium]
MRFDRPLVPVLALLPLLVSTAGAAVAVEPHAGMLRYPDVSATQIVFLYANDLWLVPREGGTAVPLASPPGEEMQPKFSPSGEAIAVMGNYDGDTDLYTVPVSGGPPQRVTYHPGTEILTDWTPDDRLVFYQRGREIYPRAQEMFAVAAGGGEPEKMPVPYGAVGAVSADGSWLAYTPHTRDFRTWKRYRGGMATDIWLFHLEELTSRRITDWEGTDTLPMWQGGAVYYLSDAGPAHRLNIWRYDVASGERRQVTTYADYDVKWPSIGPGPAGGGEIVFQHGAELVLLDLATEEARAVRVSVPGARPKIRPQSFDVAEGIRLPAISPTGQRAVVEARGDVWTLPAEKGTPRNLTRSSGVAERSPVWSPDGRFVAYSSDESGEYHLYVTQSDGRGETRRLPGTQRRFHYRLTWSPDSESLAFWDQSARLWIHDLGDGRATEVTRNPGFGQPPLAFSPDSRWLVFSMPESSRQPSSVWLYDTAAAKLTRVTGGMFNATWPTFDRDGDHLYFASQQEISEPIYDDLGTNWIYAHVDRLYAVPLRSDLDSPLAPEIDEEEWDEDGAGGEGKEKEAEAENGDGKEEDDDPAPVEIDLAGFESRAVPLPVERGNFGFLSVNDAGKLIYAHFPTSELMGEPSIHLLDLDDEDEPVKTVLEGAGSFSMSADGKKLLVSMDDRLAIVDAAADQKFEALSTSGMTATIDPRAEWRQLFRETWRLQRDFFYDPNMHGVDWEAVRAQYEPLLDDAASRDDVTFIIQEMISELNVGHAYYRPGSQEETPSVSVGMPGADFELVDGAYRIRRIVEGGPWDADARGPLSQPGVHVGVGDYLLAVNGVAVDPSREVLAAFQGLAGRTVTLTVSAAPTLDADARRVVVELPGSDYDLRYRAWVEANRAYVEGQTDGRVGYIYVPNTGVSGQDELVRQFFGQLHKPALIIDERWNGGGQIPTRFIELLNRPVANYWSLRESDDFVWPPDAHHGPKCMLINGLAGSGGDYFPFWFRESGLGKLIGTRTWGGLVGISGNPPLIDGTRTTAPTFAFYEKDGTWGIEGHGVDPDIEVIDDPARMVGGRDPQLDAAIAHMLEELERNPYLPPTPPAFPDRSGMGITEADK